MAIASNYFYLLHEKSQFFNWMGILDQRDVPILGGGILGSPEYPILCDFDNKFLALGQVSHTQVKIMVSMYAFDISLFPAFLV